MGNAGARTGLTVVGGAVGAWFGGYPGFAIGTLIGSLVGTLLFPDPNKQIYGPRITDLHVGNSSYGSPIVKIYGAARVAGNLIWEDEAQEHSHTETSGGKGGGGGVETTSYYYTQSFAFGICKGPMTQVVRIWADGKVIYDVRSYPLVETPGVNFTFYPGNETQVVDPLMESIEGVGEVPAHRGLCYIVFEDFPITDYGNRIPNLNFEVSETVSATYPYEWYDGVVSIWGQGHIVLSPDDVYASYFTSTHYMQVNLVDQTIIIADRTMPAGYAAVRVQVDTDELGRIYCQHDTGGHYYISQYNDQGDLMHTSVEAAPFDVDYEGSGVFCCRNPLYPYVGLVGGIYSYNISVINRDTMIPCGVVSYDVRTLTGVSDVRAYSMSWDDSQGICWVICHGASNSFIIKIQYPDIVSSGNINITVYDVTAHIGVGGIKIGIDSTSGLVFVVGTAHSTGNLYMWNPTSDVWTELAGTVDVYGTINRIYNHRFFVPTGATETFYEYDSLTGNIYRTIDWNGSDCFIGDPAYHQLYNGMIGYDAALVPKAGIYQRYLERSTASTVTLATIVQNICEQVGLVVTTDFVVTALAATTVRGYVINSRMEARRAIEPLQQVFLFDGCEEDGAIKFKLRGGASVVTIPEVDLAARGEGDSSVDPLTTIRTQELELPKEINVEYMDIDFDYEIGTQRARRLITQGKGPQTYSITVVMNKDEARQTAEKILTLLWKERDKYSFQLGRKYWYLSPIDVVTLTVGTATYVVFITKLDYGLSGLLKVEGVKEDSAIYTNTATGAPGEFVRPIGSSWAGPTSLVLLDIPALRDADASSSPAGMYMAATGILSAWSGSTIYKSSDSGVTFSSIVNILNEATIGVVLGTALPTIPNSNIWDKVNTINVKLRTPGATLSSSTEANVLNGANVAVVGDEIIQFVTATLEGDGTYTLSNLLRGRCGTEYAIGTHVAGETFVLLSATTTYRYAMEFAEVNASRTYRAVSIGLLFTEGSDKVFTNTGKSGLPLSVVHITGVRDGSNNLTINWIRRTRISGGWNDNADVPLGEDAEDYEVDVYDNGTVVRTIHIIAQTASYTAAEQTADGLTPGDPVHVKIYQISATFGRGFESDATI